MKVTKMRIKGELLGGLRMHSVMSELKRRFAKAGFVTGVSVQNHSSIHIGMHMRSFKIDTTKHDRNLRHSPGSNPKLTDVPTWDQRVEFNNIVNAVLNKFKVSANIKSGPFTIRSGTEAMREGDWLNQKPYWITQNENNGYYIESCDEGEFIENRRIVRNREARAKRLMRKNQQWDAAKVRLSIVERA